MVLDRFMERVDEVEVTAGAVVAAVRLSVELDSRHNREEQQERAKLIALFGRMTPEELEKYAMTGKLPNWFEELLDGTNGGAL